MTINCRIACLIFVLTRGVYCLFVCSVSSSKRLREVLSSNTLVLLVCSIATAEGVCWPCPPARPPSCSPASCCWSPARSSHLPASSSPSSITSTASSSCPTGSGCCLSSSTWAPPSTCWVWPSVPSPAWWGLARSVRCQVSGVRSVVVQCEVK